MFLQIAYSHRSIKLPNSAAVLVDYAASARARDDATVLVFRRTL